MHELPTLVGQRICEIALGYEDLNDHDQLRHDPVLALLSDQLEAKRKDCAVLSGKSTLNRLEHAPSGAPGRHLRIGHDAEAIERLFVELYLDGVSFLRGNRRSVRIRRLLLKPSPTFGYSSAGKA